MLDPNIEPSAAPAYPEQQLPPSNVAEAPVSPDEASGMSQEEMRQNLQDLMGKIDSKYQDFSVQNFSLKNKTQSSKAEALRMFFDMLKQSGVDPSNVEEVNAFLQKIKENNPEIFKQIEKILQALISGDETVPENGTTPDASILNSGTPDQSGAVAGGGSGEDQSNMNINTNETSQQNI